MKKLLYTLCLLLFSVSLCAAQKTKKMPETVDAPENTAETKRGRNFLSAGTNLEAQLEQTLDVKNSQVGDEVILKVKKSIKQDGEVIVPKGSRLIGRVTEVQTKTKETGMSKLGVVFDRIEGKNLNSPINAAVTSIFQTQNNISANNDLFDTSASGSSTASGTATTKGSGGGLLGGGGLGNTVGGVVNTTTNTVGGVSNTATNTVGSTVNTAGNTVGGTTKNLGGTLRGVQLSTSGSSNNATTLSSRDKNIKLEKGLTFQVFVSSE